MKFMQAGGHYYYDRNVAFGGGGGGVRASMPERRHFEADFQSFKLTCKSETY